MSGTFRNTEHTELIDALAEATLKTLIAYGPVVYENPEIRTPGARLPLPAAIAHNNMLGVGREQDWACHKLAMS